MSDRAWGYADEENPDRFEGAHETREGAIAEGRRAYGPAAAFYITAGDRPSPSQFIPTAADILDMISNNAEAEAGEAAEDFPPAVTEEAERELEAFLAAWTEKHLGIACDFWIGDGDVERIDPEPTHAPTEPPTPGDDEAMRSPACTCPGDEAHCPEHGPF
ncbi:MAG: hypothetical protein K0S65_6271 [Labilithrix sp.]|nr:hypothetical protein [Labilithrix sp.]